MSDNETMWVRCQPLKERTGIWLDISTQNRKLGNKSLQLRDQLDEAIRSISRKSIAFYEMSFIELNLTAKFLGFNYNSIAENGWVNNSWHAYEVDASSDAGADMILDDRVRKQQPQEYIEANTILNALCRRGVIPAGNYLIKVCL